MRYEPGAEPNLDQDEIEQSGQPEETPGGFLLDNETITADQVREWKRIATQDYKEAQAFGTKSRQEAIAAQRRAQELEDILTAAGVGDVGANIPTGIDYGRGRTPTAAAPADYGQPVVPPEVDQYIARQVETLLARRLAPLEQTKAEMDKQVRLKQAEIAVQQEFNDFKTANPGVDTAMMDRVIAAAVDRGKAGKPWAEPELLHAQLVVQDMLKEALDKQSRKRKTSSASVPATGQPVNLQNQPRTQGDLDGKLDEIVMEHLTAGLI